MPLEVERIQALCFDVDGTLSDTDDQFVQRFYRLLRPLYSSRVMSQRAARNFSRWLVMAMESPSNRAYTFVDRSRLDDALLYPLTQRLRRTPKPIPPFLIIEGVKELLAVLAQHYPLAVVSARNELGTRAFLRQFVLEGYFQAVATARTCQYTKPFPDPVLWAAKEMGVDAENCLMVGDTTVDIMAGRAAGAQTVGVLCGFGEEDELRQAGADLILAHTAMLGQALRRE